jgi:hypothetical protein
VLADVRRGGLRRDLTAGLQPEAKDSEGNLVLTAEEQIFTAVGGSESSGGTGGAGFVPGRGFPELQGYELWNNIQSTGGGGYQPGRGGSRPLDPTSRYCDLVAYSQTSYTLLIEDASDFDWDLLLDAERLSDGNIQLTLHYNSSAGYNHTIVDSMGNPTGLFECKYNGTYTTIIQCGTEAVSLDPGGPLWDQLRDYYNLRPDMFGQEYCSTSADGGQGGRSSRDLSCPVLSLSYLREGVFGQVSYPLARFAGCGVVESVQCGYCALQIYRGCLESRAIWLR